MQKLVMFVLVLMAVPFHSLFAASDAAFLSLMIAPSPTAHAMGTSFGNTWSDDPHAMWANPAAAGLFAQHHWIGGSAARTQWLPDLANDLLFSEGAVAGGYRLNASWSLGLGIGSYNLDLGEQRVVDEDGMVLDRTETFERYTGVTAAAAWNSVVNTSFGVSAKFLKQKLLFDHEKTATVLDWGAIVNWPILSTFDRGTVSTLGTPARFEITP